MKILFMKNEIFNNELLYEQIALNGFGIDVVQGNDDGLEYARTGNYDLIIMEYTFGRMHGTDIIRILRKEHINTPILMLMPGAALSDRIAGFEAGADDCVARPFAMIELIVRAKALCRRKGEYIGDEIRVGDIMLDRRSRKIVKGEHSVHLGGKEYEMMQMLALNQNQIISKAKFADKIWGYDSDAEYNNIEVYASFLRKKLRSLGSSVNIRSVRGVGYRLQW